MAAATAAVSEVERVARGGVVTFVLTTFAVLPPVVLVKGMYLGPKYKPILTAIRSATDDRFRVEATRGKDSYGKGNLARPAARKL